MRLRFLVDLVETAKTVSKATHKLTNLGSLAAACRDATVPVLWIALGVLGTHMTQLCGLAHDFRETDF